MSSSGKWGNTGVMCWVVRALSTGRTRQRSEREPAGTLPSAGRSGASRPGGVVRAGGRAFIEVRVRGGHVMRDNLVCVCAEALFVSNVQRSDAASPQSVRTAVRESVRRHGSEGCAALV